jgi:site-specific DNA recombinase
MMEALVWEIQIYEERQPNGQWLKSIKFKLPIIEQDMEISLDNDECVKTVLKTSNPSILIPRGDEYEQT